MMIKKEPEKGQDDNESLAETPPEADVETLKKQLSAEATRADINLAGWQRAQADFSNFKRRVEAEREDNTRYAGSQLMLKLIPILDDWERALASVPADAAGASWVDGIRLIERKFRGVLEAAGLASFDSLGEAFDPTRHDGAGLVPGPEGMVVAELEKGYQLYDRILRPARVFVGNGEAIKEA
jgi:molecular chaperone GrpE